MGKILIIDDDPIYSDMLKERLSRQGHQVAVHLGPFGGSAAAGQPDLDLIILDVFMPGLDGPDLLTLMRKRATGSRRAKVMFMSSMDAEPLRDLAVRNQADGSLPKSAARAEVLDYVASILTHSKAHSNKG
jgi:two-component system, OmpR family, copper resistance phosphate regulon response regulator CusR